MTEIREMLAPVVNVGARQGIKRTGMLGVTIHNTGNYGKNAGAENHAKYLQGGGKNIQASWHYAVDDKLATRSIPEDEVAWHAGDGRGNGNMKTIAIEICTNPESNLTQATGNAAELAADILKRHNLTEKNLYQHFNWSGKNCPFEIRKGNPYGWDMFVQKVKAHLTGTEPPTTKFNVGDRIRVRQDAKYTSGKAPQAWVYNSDLYIRKIAGNNITVSTSMTEKYMTGIFYTWDITVTSGTQAIFMTVSTKISPLWLTDGWNGTKPTKNIKLMPKGSQIEFLEKMNTNWYKIKFNGMVGYGSAAYLK